MSDQVRVPLAPADRSPGSRGSCCWAREGGAVAAGPADWGVREELPALPPSPSPAIAEQPRPGPALCEGCPGASGAAAARGAPGGMLPSGSVCLGGCRSPASAKLCLQPATPPSLCFSPPFPFVQGVSVGARGGLQEGDTRGRGWRPTGARTASQGSGAGSPPGQSWPWKPGSAARGELCCTFVSFRFPFPICVVGCSCPGAGFVRVRRDLQVLCLP